MKKTSPLNYAFGIGKVKVLERFLIRQEVFEEAITADLDEALRLFAESNLYNSELLHVKNSQQLEAMLNQELDNLKKLIKDLLLDKELVGLVELNTTECIQNILKIYPNEFLQDYLIHVVDMHNIKSFLRLYILKEPESKLKIALAREGFIEKKDFLGLYNQDITAFLNKLEYVHKHYRTVDYTYHLGEAIQKTLKEHSFVYLEKAINDFLITVLKPAKYLSFGPEPILAYYFAKVNEINLVRMIILAKLNGISADLVKERLNIVYA